MDRRRFFLSLLTAAAVRVPPGEPSDVGYADVTQACRHLVIPYLNGRPVRLAQAASVAEGWVDVLDRWDLTTIKRRHGEVVLKFSTKERAEDLMRNGAYLQ